MEACSAAIRAVCCVGIIIGFAHGIGGVKIGGIVFAVPDMIREIVVTAQEMLVSQAYL